MNRESVLVIDIWEVVNDVIPPGKRMDAAVGILRAFIEYGVEPNELGHIADEDPLLARAFAEVAPDEDHEDDHDEDDED